MLDTNSIIIDKIKNCTNDANLKNLVPMWKLPNAPPQFFCPNFVSSLPLTPFHWPLGCILSNFSSLQSFHIRDSRLKCSATPTSESRLMDSRGGGGRRMRKCNFMRPSRGAGRGRAFKAEAHLTPLLPSTVGCNCAAATFV